MLKNRPDLKTLKPVLALLIVAVFLSGCAGVTPGRVKLKASVSSTVAEGKQARVQEIKKVIVFVTGTDPDLARLFEDAVNVELVKAGYTIVSRAKSERLFQEELAKPKDQQVMGAVKIAKGAEAEGVIAVNLDALSSQLETSSRGEIKQKTLNAASLQLIDVENEQVLAVSIAEYPTGAGLLRGAKDLIAVVTKSEQ